MLRFRERRVLGIHFPSCVACQCVEVGDFGLGQGVGRACRGGQRSAGAFASILPFTMFVSKYRFLAQEDDVTEEDELDEGEL